MSKVLPSKVVFDNIKSALEVLARDWAERECTTFDDAVRIAAGQEDQGGGSIWDMPRIDSKRTVSLLVELEGILGCEIPVKVLKRGGYQDVDELLGHLMPRIRELCPETKLPRRSVAAPNPNPQV